MQAWGYVTKTERPETVIKAIRSVAGGVAYFSPAVQERLVVGSKGARLAEKNETLTATLTPREKEVLCYLARGHVQEGHRPDHVRQHQDGRLPLHPTDGQAQDPRPR